MGITPWDGVAQLWYDEPWPPLTEAIGIEPADTFQEKAEPYMSWATTEYVYLDGELPVVPLTLNDAFPTTRSGFHKTTLLGLRDQRDRETFIDYWLNDHAPRATQRQQAEARTWSVLAKSQTSPLWVWQRFTLTARSLLTVTSLLVSGTAWRIG